jgi:endonuclease YncB( thermonuclease family)
LSDRATAAAEALIGRARTLTVAPTGRFDTAGRAIVFVSLDGRDLGELLIAQGAARPARAERLCDNESNS